MDKRVYDWLSYHIYLPWTGNEFLADFLPQLIFSLKKEKQIKRFFFIRFAEGSYHIRLRLQKTLSSNTSEIERQINSVLEDFRSSLNFTSSQVRLEKTEYSRDEHYFGETLQSVYAELINEATSYLAMHMLAGVKDANYFLLLKFAATVFWLFRFSALDKTEMKMSIKESCEFAEKNKSGENEIKFNAENFLQKVTVVIERMSTASGDPDLQKAAVLIKRLKQYVGNGRPVATHAIHLYCNKLGFSMSQEAQIYRILYEI